MARKCSICSHPNRNAIEVEMYENKHPIEIANQFGVTTTSLWRHQKNHMRKEAFEAVTALGQGLLPMPVEVSPAKAERMARHIDVVDQMMRLNEEAWDVLGAAKEGGSPQLRAMAIEIVHKNIELMAKLSIFARLDADMERRGEARKLSDALEELVDRTRQAAPA